MRSRERILRLARLLPLIISAFELRGLLGRISHLGAALSRIEHAYGHSPAPWIVTALALGGVWMLREAARGLRTEVIRPRWSATLVGLWLVCSGLTAAVLCGQDLLHDLASLGHSARPANLIGSGDWSAVASAVMVGFALAVSLCGARWVCDELRRSRRSPGWRIASGLPSVRTAVSADPRPRPAPLLAGWSDRGPPLGRLAATA